MYRRLIKGGNSMDLNCVGLYVFYTSNNTCIYIQIRTYTNWDLKTISDACRG